MNVEINKRFFIFKIFEKKFQVLNLESIYFLIMGILDNKNYIFKLKNRKSIILLCNVHAGANSDWWPTSHSSGLPSLSQMYKLRGTAEPSKWCPLGVLEQDP